MKLNLENKEAIKILNERVDVLINKVEKLEQHNKELETVAKKATKKLRDL